MKSPFHYIQFKKYKNTWVKYSDKYLTDMHSIEPLNDTNTKLLKKHLLNNDIEKSEHLDTQIENLLHAKKVADYKGGYYYYISGLPCNLEGYWIVREGEDYYPLRGQGISKYLHITNGINMYKVTES